MNKIILLFIFLLSEVNSSNGQQVAQERNNCRIAEQLYRYEEDSTKQGSPQSQALLDSAIKICPGYSIAYMEKSVAFNKTGDFYQGFLWLNKAVALNPTNHLGYRGWIRLRKLRDFKGAEKDLIAFHKLTASKDYYVWGEHLYYLLGECKLGMNELDSAMYYYEKYIQIGTRDRGESFIDVYAFVYAGIVAFHKNQYSNALIHFEKALNYYPLCAEALYYKALGLYRTGKKEEALFTIKKAKTSFEAGYYHRDKYNEYIYQLYDSDITDGIRLISETN